MRYKLKINYENRALGRKYGARWNAIEKVWMYETDGELPDELKRYVVEAQKPEGSQDFVVRQEGMPALPDLDKFRTVTELNQFIRGVYGQLPAFRSILVKGEVANFTPPKRNGNLFFSLKEGDKALINCVLWGSDVPGALNFELKNGLQVALEGRLDYYEGGGRTQITVRKLFNIGAGEAAIKLMMLRKKLEALGWFAEELKKPIPKHPRSIGIVTSESGQAIQDFESTAKKRNPFVQLELCPVNVQGIYAAETIVKGIEFMDRRGYDLIIVGRGGGSDEELYVFNDEAIVTAVHNARTPIVSAVGHTGNFTLIDAVADGFANTPTGAIEKYVPDLQADLDTLHSLMRLFRNNADRILSRKREDAGNARIRLEQLTPAHRIHLCSEALQQYTAGMDNVMRRLLHNNERTITETNRTLEKNRPDLLVQRRNTELMLETQRLSGNVQNVYTAAENRFRLAVTELHGKSPTAKLINGFGYITHDDLPVRNVSDVKPGDELTLTLHDGTITAETHTIKQKEKL
ncbi:MAG: exodeoxyribonuclease VII large subunit [Solobacterium sp.]|nr:exodeoxyribonuclease VII large subunit [Solobacterium sp.]